MCEQSVGAFFGVTKRNGSANAAVCAGYECDTALEPSVAGVGLFTIVGGWFKVAGIARRSLLLGRKWRLRKSLTWIGEGAVFRSGADGRDVGIRGSLLVPSSDA